MQKRTDPDMFGEPGVLSHYSRINESRLTSFDQFCELLPLLMQSITNNMKYILDIMPFIYYYIHMNQPARMKLKLARIEKNLTQQELADQVEVTRQTIGLIEKGNYNPTLNLCLKIARTLDRTLDQLFWEDEKHV